MNKTHESRLAPTGRWFVAAVLILTAILGPVVHADASVSPAISGRVTNLSGDGIPGVVVRAVDSATWSTNDHGVATTDADGYYTVVLEPGSPSSVVIMFDPSASNVDNDTDYLGEFYGDTIYVLSATPVAPGASNVDTQLAAGGSVSGTVYEPDGSTPVAGIAVRVATGSAFDPSTTTGVGGTYVLRGVAPGLPSVRAITAAYNEANDTDFTDASQSVSVTAGAESSGTNITLGQGGCIEGTVTGGGGPLGGVKVTAQDPSVWWNPMYTAYTEPDGTYVVRGLSTSANYRVLFSPAEHNAANDAGWASEYYSNVRLASSFIPVSVTSALSTMGINADLEVGGTVSGTVYASDGTTPLEGILVQEYMGSASDMTDANGDYTLKGFNTGSAGIRFDPTAYNSSHGTSYDTEYYNNQTSAMTINYVSVTLGMETSGIDATLEGGPIGGGDTIEGHVYDADGVTPLSGIDVWAVDLMGMPLALATTDSDGAYWLTDVSGSVRVWFSASDYNVANGTSYASEYYDDEQDWDLAEWVPAGSTDIDAWLSTPSTLVTDIAVDPMMPDGAIGIYKTAPTITLSCADPSATIWYYWNADAPAEYVDPLTAPEGGNTLTYYAEDALGNLEPEQMRYFPVDSVAPAAPNGVTATAAGENAVDVAWDTVTEDADGGLDSSGIVLYRVYVDGLWAAETGLTSCQVSGLEPGTTYEVAVVAIDTAGNVSDSASDFVTTDADATAPVSTITVTDGVLGTDDWYTTPPTVTLESNEPGTTWYQWGVDAPSEYSDPLTAPEGVTALSVWSVDTLGNTETPPQTSVFFVDTVAPAAPEGFSATAAGSHAVDLAWDAVTLDADGNGDCSGVVYYRIWGGPEVYETTDTSYQMTDLMPDTYYDFWVTAVDAAGNEGLDAYASATTDPDVTAPTTTLLVVDGTIGLNGWYTDVPSITLTADEPGFSWYQWDTDSDATPYMGSFAPIPGEHTLTYWSEDDWGNAENQQIEAFKLDTSAPATPTGLVAVQTAPGTVEINWDAASDSESGISGYALAQSGPQNGSWDVPGVTYTATGLPAGTYTYTIEAVNIAGLRSGASASVEVTVDNTAPTSVLGVDPTAPDGANSWYITAPQISITSETGASIFYQWDAGGPVEYEGPLVPAAGEHTLTYWSVDAAGNVEDPKPTRVLKVDTVAPRMPDTPLFVAGQTTVDLMWNAVTDDADGGADSSGITSYRVYQDGTKIADVDSSATTYQVTGLAPNTDYSFSVSAVDAAGTEGAQSGAANVTTAADTTAPAAPTGLTAAASSHNSIVLSWNEATDISGIAKYTVYYANGTKIADVTAPATSYTVTGLSATTVYSFYVTAHDTVANESAPSATASATTPPAPVAASPVYRFFNFRNNTHFFTDSDTERDQIIAQWANTFRFEGVAYYTDPSRNTQRLYRFYNRVSQSHFYTASPDEANTILARWPNVFSLEGQTYAVSPVEVPNSAPVFRFYNLKNGSHFFTASAQERDTVVSQWSGVYRFEGTAYWIAQ